MSEENKNVVVEEKDIEVTEVAKVEAKKPNLIVKAGKWIWDKKGYIATAIGGIATGLFLANKFGCDGNDECEYETTDNEVAEADEGPTED